MRRYATATNIVLFLLCVFVVAGAGKLSLDYVTFGPGRTHPSEEPPAPAVPTI